ncbi:MAG TPA: sugar ABC transporter ATP-binding protein [Gaiellaceae bacterium]
MSGPAPAVTVSGVRKRFGDVRALDGCSITAFPGEIHAIVGENGSGKSTLVKVLSSVLPPDEGEVSILGRQPSSPRAALRGGIATVFQEILVVEGASVLDNLFLGHDGLLRSGRSTKEKVALAEPLLERLMQDSIDVSLPIDDLPLSTRQWIVIARALLGDPRVLILDEATAALDEQSSRRLFETLERLAGDGVCVLLISHRIAELTSFADRATVLRDGATVGTLTRDEITGEQLLRLMSGGSLSAERSAPARRELGPPAIRLDGLRIAPGSPPIDAVVSAGEILGIAALEGHGAPELVQTIAGIRAPLAGTVEIVADGRSHVVRSLRDAERAGVGYVSGDRTREGLFPNLSVLQNFGMALYRRSTRAGVIAFGPIRRRFVEQSERLSITARRQSSPVTSLSGGNQQKVLIGRVLAASPRIVVLNDPTRGVDIRTKQDLYALLRELAAEGKAVILFSTEIEELVDLCRRVVVLRHGGSHTTISEGELTPARVLAGMFGRGETGSGAA